MPTETYLIIQGEIEALRVYDEAEINTTDGRIVKINHSNLFGGGTSIRERFSRRSMNAGDIGNISLSSRESFDIPHTNPKVTVVCAKKAE